MELWKYSNQKRSDIYCGLWIKFGLWKYVWNKTTQKLHYLPHTIHVLTFLSENDKQNYKSVLINQDRHLYPKRLSMHSCVLARQKQASDSSSKVRKMAATMLHLSRHHGNCPNANSISLIPVHFYHIVACGVTWKLFANLWTLLYQYFLLTKHSRPPQHVQVV